MDTINLLIYNSLIMWPSARIKRCTLSTCHVPPIFSEQERHRNFWFSGDTTLDKSN